MERHIFYILKTLIRFLTEIRTTSIQEMLIYQVHTVLYNEKQL